MLLFVDTETTGKLDFKLPLLHPSQPRLVQLGAQLVDDTDEETSGQRVVRSLDVIVRPDGWTISKEVSKIHGITHEQALAFGRPMEEVLSTLVGFLTDADEGAGKGRFIAHNIKFDSSVLLSEFGRADNTDAMHVFNLLRPFCTMQSLTQRMKLPGKFGKYKWPKLDEAYQFCFGTAVPGREEHHGAMVDLLACKDIFFHGRSQEWWR